MPKTNEKDAYYFPHDCNARNDPKILALRSVFGAEGYGIYFMLIEILREQPDYKLQVTKYLYHTLAMQMQVQKDRLQEIVDACCTDFSEGNSTLLINDGAYLFSDSLLRRMGRVDDISKLRREAARKRWENQPCKGDNDFETEQENASALQMQSKEKKSKAKQSRAEQRKADIFSAFAGGDTGLLSALRGFEQMRIKSKRPMTDEAKKRMLTKLEKLSQDRAEQIEILHQSEDVCWLGLFPLKDACNRQAAGGKPQQASAADKMDALRELHGEFCDE